MKVHGDFTKVQKPTNLAQQQLIWSYFYSVFVNLGKVRLVPDPDYHYSEPILRGPNKGFVDKFGNEWVKGPSRTLGQPFEWDVQLSPLGQKQLG